MATALLHKTGPGPDFESNLVCANGFNDHRFVRVLAGISALLICVAVSAAADAGPDSPTSQPPNAEGRTTGSSGGAELANMSTRGFVELDDNVMIGGFVLGGGIGSTSVVVRGIGPSLAQFGLNPLLADPTLELYDGNGTLLISNNDWQDNPAQASLLDAFGLAPQNARESAVVMSLPPGAFTAILAGSDRGTGIGLVELYNVH
jgi:hypothetical protein